MVNANTVISSVSQSRAVNFYRAVRMSKTVFVAGSGCMKCSGAQNCLCHGVDPGNSVLVSDLIKIRGPSV